MERVVLSGIPLLDGIAVGKILYLDTDFSQKLSSYEKGSPDLEKNRFDAALQGAISDLNATLEQANISDEEREIIGNHVMLLEDEAFLEMTASAMEEDLGAPEAVLSSVAAFQAMFEEIDDEYLRDRANDVVDIGNRVIRKILGISEAKVTGENLILLAKDIEPALMASLSENQVRAILLENGSKTSHSIIIAKSKGFVTMVGVDTSIGRDYQGQTAVVDTEKKVAILSPEEAELAEYQKKAGAEADLLAALLANAKKPATSKDGKNFLVAANVSSPEEMEKAVSYGCEGVGLYRTEFLFLEQDKLPSEEVQFDAYRALLSKADGQKCIIRTLDIGGDKKCDALGLAAEDNPFLGYRAVRICLDQTEVFRTQLRALLRASVYGKLGIMIPMIDTLAEIRSARSLLEEIKAELTEKGIPFDSEVEFGIMTETPASAFMAESFAKYVDFFSIGTNDLVQYTMAVDRGNQKVSYLYDYLDPAVLRAILAIVKGAHSRGIPVGMCGEMAGDVLAVPFLMAIGLDEFSVSISAAPKVKDRIRSLDCKACDLERLLSFETAEEVRAYLGAL